MNKKTEDVWSSLFNWLLQDPGSEVSSPSGMLPASSEYSQNQLEAGDLQFDKYDPLDLEAFESSSPILNSSESFSFQGVSPFELGDGSAVEDRFHTLIKRRLKVEIQQNLPLFPWETELQDYPVDYVADSPSHTGHAPSVWDDQLQRLKLPVPLPVAVLTDLFGQCRELVQTSLREGERLVRAVDTLFPDSSQLLNDLAGRVLIESSVRYVQDGDGTGQELSADLPSTYELASVEQQMALSLLAAHEIMETLTLKVSERRKQQEREWVTSVGSIILETEYRPDSPALLMVQAWLPCGGQIKFRGGGVQSIAQRPSSGSLSVVLPNPHFNQPWSLEVDLAELDQQPLKFSVQLVEDR